MKKSWKKLLCSMALVPCLFATACGKDPEEPPANTGLTVEQMQEAYTYLRSNSAKVLKSDGQLDSAFTMKYLAEHKNHYDFTNSGLLEENAYSYENYNESSEVVIQSNTVYAGYKSNGTGYKNSVERFYSKSSNVDNVTTSYDITKKEDDKFVNYSNEKDIKTKSLVSNDYSKKSYIVNEGYMGLEYRFNHLEEVIDDIEEVDTLEKYKPVIADWSANLFASNRLDTVAEPVDFTPYMTCDYNLTLTDGTYSLVVDIDVDATNSDIDFFEDGVFKADGTINIKFDKDNVKLIDINYVSKMIKTESSSVFFGELQESYGENGNVVITDSSSYQIALDMTTGFDNSFYNQTLEGYNGTGENGEPANRLTEIEILCSCEGGYYTTVKAPYGDNLRQVIDSAIYKFTTEHDLAIKYMYWDVHASEKVSADAVVPAHNALIYIDLVKKGYEFEPVEVNLVIESHLIMKTCYFIPGLNLFDCLSEDLELEDGMILGAFSDKEMTMSYDENTSVVADMNVYLNLVEGWSDPRTNTEVEE